MKHCEYCGTQLNDNARICVVCGRKPSNLISPMPAQPAPVPVPVQSPAPEPVPVQTSAPVSVQTPAPAPVSVQTPAPAPAFVQSPAPIDYGQNISVDYGQNIPVDYGQSPPVDCGQDIPIDYGQDIPNIGKKPNAYIDPKLAELKKQIIGESSEVKRGLFSPKKKWRFWADGLYYFDKDGDEIFRVAYEDIVSVRTGHSPSIEAIIELIVGLTCLEIGLAEAQIFLFVGLFLTVIGSIFLVQRKITIYTNKKMSLIGHYKLKNRYYPINTFLDDIEAMRK